jgi:hypothetical protein
MPDFPSSLIRPCGSLLSRESIRLRWMNWIWKVFSGICSTVLFGTCYSSMLSRLIDGTFLSFARPFLLHLRPAHLPRSRLSFLIRSCNIFPHLQRYCLPIRFVSHSFSHSSAAPLQSSSLCIESSLLSSLSNPHVSPPTHHFPLLFFPLFYSPDITLNYGLVLPNRPYHRWLLRNRRPPRRNARSSRRYHRRARCSERKVE